MDARRSFPQEAGCGAYPRCVGKRVREGGCSLCKWQGPDVSRKSVQTSGPFACEGDYGDVGAVPAGWSLRERCCQHESLPNRRAVASRSRRTLGCYWPSLQDGFAWKESPAARSGAIPPNVSPRSRAGTRRSAVLRNLGCSGSFSPQ